MAGSRVAGLTIREATLHDGARLADIYNPYIRDTWITFETELITPDAMSRRVAQCTADRLPWLVAESDEQLVGYAYASKWKGRCAYRYSVESTVYLDPASVGAGIGRQLYAALIDRLRLDGFRSVIGGISLPNPASVRLHEQLGFQKVGHFAAVGYKQETWIDVGYWQLQL